MTAGQHRVSVRKPREQATDSDLLKLKADFAKVAATESGQRVLRWLAHFLGFKQSSLTMSENGELLIQAIVHNEARRNVWLDIRKLIPIKALNEIEKEVSNATEQNKG